MVLAVGHTGNTGEEYSQAEAWVRDPVNALKPEAVNTSMVSEGRLPIVIEPIAARLKIRCPEPQAVYPLSEEGRRRRAVPFSWQDGVLTFGVGGVHRTVFYQIAAD